MTKITLISDTHNYHNDLIIPKSDIIIHAGDYTNMGRTSEVLNFLNWYRDQPSKHKILINGNHEVGISQNLTLLREMCKERNITYLENESIEIEDLKIFGTPYSVKFGDWAYDLPDDDLKTIWDQIPLDTDILVVHGPPHEMLDKCPGGNVGSKTLKERLNKLNNLRLVVTGHIHEGRGILDLGDLLVCNAAVCDIPYHKRINKKPFTVDL